jgi:NitT/TauT family transport system substrate-binding protein
MHSAVSGSQALLSVVQEAGLFTRQGLEVEVVTGTPRTASAGLIAGESPIVVGSGAQLVATGLAGGDVVMVASAVNMMDTSIWTRDVTDPVGLRGRRIGISVLGDSTDLAARFAARRWGLDPTTDWQIVQVGQPGERLAALEAGAVDATIIQPPQTVRARQTGLRKLAEMADLGMEYQHTGVLTTRGRIADEPALVDRFVRAWAEGVYYYGANPRQAREAVGHFMRLDDADALEETYRHYRTLYVRPPYPTLQGIQSVLDAAVDEDPRALGVRPETFVDTRFLDALAAEGQFQTWEQEYRMAPSPTSSVRSPGPSSLRPSP